jgi:nucleolar pre-ribosomal-associated protein 2
MSLKDAQTVFEVGYCLTDILCILQSKVLAFKIYLPSLTNIAQTYMVSQFAVECVLDAILSLMTPGSHKFLLSEAARVYLRLCQITNLLLVLHRKNFGGRMHLLVPVLQSLANPLFQPDGTGSASRCQKPPSWLSTRKPVLGQAHATAYSRILHTLAEPTASSTRAHHHRAADSTRNPWLTDETRKAREYAARYIPYVLAHLCAMHLVGHIPPELRRAVLPGVWVCVEAVPREGLRGMNASLGRDDRAIWASLWAEWSRTHGQMGLKRLRTM